MIMELREVLGLRLGIRVAHGRLGMGLGIGLDMGLVIKLGIGLCMGLVMRVGMWQGIGLSMGLCLGRDIGLSMGLGIGLYNQNRHKAANDDTDGVSDGAVYETRTGQG